MQGCGGSAFYSVPIPAPVTPCFAGFVRLCEDGGGVERMFHLVPPPRRVRSPAPRPLLCTERTGPNGASRNAARSDQWEVHRSKTVRFRMSAAVPSPEYTETERKRVK
ncbi:hypothetical protein D3867_25295 (plasmid) [Azospirillum argentinense]|uniref:Uncharacterized protein n=1 Tax=Azospirillum brasilense TaxID=192 RepID=A0A4D8Q5H5_AZOBR|nr:hypothetical protein D3867_25295 [Azospirillum argentinense]